VGFLTALEQTAFAQWVRESGSIWAFPTVLVLHTIGMAILAGLSSIIDLRLLGLWPQMRIKPLERLYPLMMGGFWINLITGSMLFMGDAATKGINPDFYIKMVFVVVAMLTLKRMRRVVFANSKIDTGAIPADARTLAMISLFAWLATITAGRLLAYVGPVAGLAK
jgi:hypothetical protein